MARKKITIPKLLKPSLKTTRKDPSKPLSEKRVKESKEVDLLLLKQEMLLPGAQDIILAKQRAEISQGIKQLIIPYTPSIHQQEVHALTDTARFGVVVVHRGWGKTWLAANELIRRAWACTSPQGGKFIYIAPEKLQAKKIVWRELKYFVKDLPHSINEAELVISFPNGATVELAGADNPDRLRGQHPHYVVLDEVAQMPRDTWYEAVYPSLRAHKGGALFIGTPKGDNLFRELYDHAQSAKGWFAYRKTIFDTNVATEEDIEDLMITMPKHKFEQEYLCSFDAAIQGAYFDYLFSSVELNLVGDVPWDPGEPVFTGWDIGINDPTSIWFFQKDKFDSTRLRVIDFYEKAHPDFNEHLKAVQNKPYVYSSHYMPHDINKRVGLGSSTRYELCLKHGMDVKIASKTIDPQEGITMVQRLIPLCKFDSIKCREGLAHLKQYTARQNRQTGEFDTEAKHDAHSHAADAFRYIAVGMRKSHGRDASHLAYAQSSYDYFNPSNAGRSSNEQSDFEYDPFNIQ